MQQPAIKLPVAALREVGPATQTLGGILKLSLKETFASASTIAKESRLPVKTVRNHMVLLCDKSWIHNNGREHTRAGRARRTCTIRTTVKTLDAVKDYCPLPWWTVATPPGKQWCSRVLWAAVVRRWLELRAGILSTISGDGQTYTEMDLPDYLDEIGGEDRFGFSLSQLQEQTGLTKDSIVTAKRILTKAGFIHWFRGDGPSAPDLLVPDWNVRIVEESAGNGMCRIHVIGGSKNG